MAFEPEKITRDHILQAVEIIESEERVLYPSTGYDVIINGKAYPPKEVIRIAHELATGSAPGIIYGGEQVNKHFISVDTDPFVLSDLVANHSRSRPTELFR